MDEAKITLPNGITLDPKGGWAEGIRRHAVARGFADARAFLSTDPGGYREYLLVFGTEPQKACRSFEAMCAHIDMLAMAESMPEPTS